MTNVTADNFKQAVHFIFCKQYFYDIYESTGGGYDK